MDQIWQTILLGIIEGITEFLPISSTGHLLIAEHWLGLRSETFNISIQLGAVLAVAFIYHRRLLELMRDWRTPANFDYLSKLAGAFVLTAVLGLITHKLGWKLPETVTPVAWALIIGGLFIFLAEWRARHCAPVLTITWTIALAVGLAQIVAGIFPGTSRSAATILIALLLGAARPAATEFAFILGIPTMLAATSMALFKDLRSPHPDAIEPWFILLLAFIVAAIVGFLTVKWLLRYVQSHSFVPFAWYRLALGMALLVWLH